MEIAFTENIVSFNDLGAMGVSKSGQGYYYWKGFIVLWKECVDDMLDSQLKRYTFQTLKGCGLVALLLSHLSP